MREALRVGRRVFLTTPNRWFPVEVHTRLPLVHWLPDSLAGRVYDLTGRSWARENHLLGPAELRALFPVSGADLQPRPDARRDDMTARLPRAGAAVLRRSASPSTTSRWRCSGRPASGISRSTSSPPGRRRSSSRRSSPRSCAAGAIPRLRWADRFALAYGAIVVVYWLLRRPGSTARRPPAASSTRCVTTCCRSAPTSSGGSSSSSERGGARLLVALVAVAVALAVWGLVDVYAVPLDWWRDSGVPGWFGEQLGLAYECLSGLPENWILNTRRGEPGAAARLDVPQPARDRVPARRRAAPARRRAAAAMDGRGGRRGLRGIPLDAHARGLHRAAGRARRARRSCAARGRRRRSRSARWRSRPRSSRSSPRSGPRRPTRARSSRASVRTRRSRARRRTIRSAPTRARPRVTCGRCATGSRPSPPPVGVRARERRCLGVTNRCRDQGGRVDLHRARGRHRGRRAGGVRRVARRARARAAAPLSVARGLARLGRSARPADRRDRDPLARGRRLRACGGGACARQPDESPAERAL